MANSKHNSRSGTRKELEAPKLRLQVQELLFDLVNSRVRVKLNSTEGTTDSMTASLFDYVNQLDQAELKNIHLKLAEAYLHEVDYLVSQGHLLNKGKEENTD